MTFVRFTNFTNWSVDTNFDHDTHVTTLKNRQLEEARRSMFFHRNDDVSRELFGITTKSEIRIRRDTSKVRQLDPGLLLGDHPQLMSERKFCPGGGGES